jgi:DNA-directed RNA polymerase specialized sigma24 family protein
MHRETQFQTVLEANQDRIYRICCCYIRDEDERQDVFPEVLLQIWKSLDTFANRSAISTWIFRVAVNVCLGHLRLAQRRKPCNSGKPVPSGCWRRCAASWCSWGCYAFRPPASGHLDCCLAALWRRCMS